MQIEELPFKIQQLESQIDDCFRMLDQLWSQLQNLETILQPYIDNYNHFNK